MSWGCTFMWYDEWDKSSWYIDLSGFLISYLKRYLSASILHRFNRLWTLLLSCFSLNFPTSLALRLLCARSVIRHYYWLFDCRLQWVGKSFSESAVGRFSMNHTLSSNWEVPYPIPVDLLIRRRMKEEKLWKIVFWFFQGENMKNELAEWGKSSICSHFFVLYQNTQQ